MNEPCGLYTSGKNREVPLEGVKVSAVVVGRGAKVTVTQRFRNKEGKPVEAIYKFPLPERAAVCGFEGLIGGRVIRGEVEEREEAFRKYDEALAKGDLATILDQERPNIFTLSVGRIDPAAEAVIRIDYVTLLDTDGKDVRFFLPTTISPRYLPDGAPDRDGIPEDDLIHPPYAADVQYGLSLTVDIRKGSLLRSVESPSHQVRMEKMEGDTIRVTFAQETARMDRDFVLNLEEEGNPVGRAYRQLQDGEEFLQVDVCLPADDRKGKTLKGKGAEVVFLVDCSGSMSGDSIEEVRRAVEICLKGMKEGILFNIWRFGTSHESLFPKPLPYSQESAEKALEYVRKMEADLGGTEILKPLREILSGNGREKERGKDIVLLTDGEVGNETEIFDLLRKRGDRARVFPIGIGAGCNEHFIKGLARAGKGASEFIYPGERIEPKTLRLFGLLGSGSITGLTVSTMGEQAPADPALFVGRPATVFVKGRKGEFAKKVAVKAEVNGVKKVWEVEVVDAGGESLPIPLLWARERIRDLEEGHGVKGSRQAGRKKAANAREVIDLSKKYGILSQSTSYVAVQELEEKDRFTGEVVLRKVPTLVTVGWHGIGNVPGAARARLANIASFSVADYENAAVWDAQPQMNSRIGNKLMHRESPRPPTAQPAVSLAGPDFAKIADEINQIVDESIGEMTTGKKEAENRPPKASIQRPSKEDILLTILSSQRPGAGFDPSGEIAALLGFSFDEIRYAADAMTVRVYLRDQGRFEDPYLLLSTAVILVVLKRFFAEDRKVWEGVVGKSGNWLYDFVGRYRPKIGDVDLMPWAEDFVRHHVRLPE